MARYQVRKFVDDGVEVLYDGADFEESIRAFGGAIGERIEDVDSDPIAILAWLAQLKHALEAELNGGVRVRWERV